MEDSGLRIGRPDEKHGASLSTHGGTWALLTWGRRTIAQAKAQGVLALADSHAPVDRY